MKKIISLILITVILLVSLYSCSSDNTNVNGDNSVGGDRNISENALDSSNGNNKTEIDKENVSYGNAEGLPAATVESLKETAKTPESNFKYKEIDGCIQITGYVANDSIVSIPETIGGLPVTKIGNYAFANNTCIKGLIIPDSVAMIGTNAFENSVLEVFVSGKGLKEIGDFGFSSCFSLKTVELNEGIETLGLLCFASAKSLNELYIPSSATQINAILIGGGNEPVTIIAEKGSAAETYALENNISFREK